VDGTAEGGMSALSFGRLVRWYDARWPVYVGEAHEPMEFFWRLCWWLKGHGFIAHVGSSAFRDFVWNPLFFLGPYWRAPKHRRGSLGRVDVMRLGLFTFRESCVETWRLFFPRRRAVWGGEPYATISVKVR
jgi:hypothetical protein